MLQRTKDIYIKTLHPKTYLKLAILDALLKKEFQPNIAKKFGVSLKKVERIEKEYKEDIAMWMFHKEKN